MKGDKFFEPLRKYHRIIHEEYGYCSLIKAATNVLEKMRIENTTHAKVTSTTRVEKNLVESVALRKAIINAIVHNDFQKNKLSLTVGLISRCAAAFFLILIRLSAIKCNMKK